MKTEVKSRVDSGTLTTGIVMITLGIIFLLTRLDLADFGQVVRRYWPLIVVIIGVGKLFARETVWSGLWFIVVGGWLQMAHLEIFGLTYRSSWPLLLIALGGGLVLRAFVEAMFPPREEADER